MFGEAVAGHRQRLGWTQQELARRAGLSERAIRDLEAGRVKRPRQVSVRLLADALGLHGHGRADFVRRAGDGAPPPAVPAGRGGQMRPPVQLPLAVRGFAGRASELAALDALVPTSSGRRPATVVISAIAGTPGVGKTSLAVHWAHRVSDRFPDGQLYVNLRGFDPGRTATPAEVLRRFLDALEVPAERIPADLDSQAALFRSLLAGRRMLLLLDNARDAEQVRPLLPGTPGSMVVVTSRSDLAGLVADSGAQPLTLDLLTREESWQLLAARLGEDRLVAERGAVEGIVASCARLPLALALVAARAAAHPDFPLGALAEELSSPADPLSALTSGDPAGDMRALLSWSYTVLSPPAARLFRLLGRYCGPDLSVPAAASLAGLPRAHVLGVLHELTAAHLLVEHLPRRYTLHDLLRRYAAEQEPRPGDDADAGGPAVRRLLDHYVLTAHAGDRLLDPHRDPITPVAPLPGVTLERLADGEQARAWFINEHSALLAAVHQAVEAGLDDHVWQLAWSLATYLDWQGHWRDYLATQGAALAAARRSGDVAAQAMSRRLLGRAHGRLGRLDEAHDELQQALALYGLASDPRGQALVHLNLTWIMERRGRQVDALGHARAALGLYRVAGDLRGEAMALNAVGWGRVHLGDHAEALDACQQAVGLFQSLGDRANEAAAWDSVGYAHHRRGEHDEATASFGKALALYRDMGDRYLEADTLTHLGDARHAAGDTSAARRAWADALALLDELGHEDAAGVRAKLRNPAAGETAPPTGDGPACPGESSLRPPEVARTEDVGIWSPMTGS